MPKRARVAALMRENLPRVHYETEDCPEEQALLLAHLAGTDLELLPSATGSGEEDIEETRVQWNRQKELEELEKFEAYVVIRSSEMPVGARVLPTRFVDTAEKSRFVAKEIATYRTDEFFAPSSTAPTSRMIDILACKCGLARLTLDVKRAFLNVPEDEEIYVQPPREWLESQSDQEVVWRMNRVLYGRRKGTSAFVEFLASLLGQLGFERCAAAPQLFRKRSTVMEAHVDDLHAAGEVEDLRQLAEKLEAHVAIKGDSIYRPGSTGEYEHLRRTRMRTRQDIFI